MRCATSSRNRVGCFELAEQALQRLPCAFESGAEAAELVVACQRKGTARSRRASLSESRIRRRIGASRRR